MSCMFVPNFEAIGRVTLVLGPENLPESLAEKAVSINNALSTPKNISQDYTYMSYLFIPTNPTSTYISIIILFE